MKVINLRNCNITYIQEARIIPFDKLNLAQLYIGNNKLCDDGVMKISSINSPSLTTFDLSSTYITEVSVDSIVEVICTPSMMVHTPYTSSSLPSNIRVEKYGIVDTADMIPVLV